MLLVVAWRAPRVPAAVRVLVEHYEEMDDSVLRLLAEEQRMPSLRRIADAGRADPRRACAVRAITSR